MKELKLKKLNKEISEDDFKKQATEIKGSKDAPVVLIKATDDASYRNLVDALDEMQICNIGKYAIVDITDGDKFLIDNLKSGGELTKQIARSNPKNDGYAKEYKPEFTGMVRVGLYGEESGVRRLRIAQDLLLPPYPRPADRSSRSDPDHGIAGYHQVGRPATREGAGA